MRFLYTVFFLGWAVVASAGSLSERVHDQYEKISSLKAKCTQILTNAASKQVETRAGSLLFKKPGLVRWQSKSGEDEELLVVGPEKVWNYFPADMIAYVSDSKQAFASQKTLRLLTGEARLEEDFILEQQGEEQGLLKVKLTPKEPESDLVLAWFWLNQKTSLVERLLLIDFFGNGNELRLHDIELNIDLSDSMFLFTPPEGVHVEKFSGHQ